MLVIQHQGVNDGYTRSAVLEVRPNVEHEVLKGPIEQVTRVEEVARLVFGVVPLSGAEGDLS